MRKDIAMTKPKRIGERWQYRDMVFWPCNGLIYTEDMENGEFVVVSLANWCERILAFRRDVDRLRIIAIRTKSIAQRRSAIEDREVLQALVDAMVEAGLRAKAQGSPSDPKVLKFVHDHQRKKPRIVVPGLETASAERKELYIPGKS